MSPLHCCAFSCLEDSVECDGGGGYACCEYTSYRVIVSPIWECYALLWYSMRHNGDYSQSASIDSVLPKSVLFCSVWMNTRRTVLFAFLNYASLCTHFHTSLTNNKHQTPAPPRNGHSETAIYHSGRCCASWGSMRGVCFSSNCISLDEYGCIRSSSEDN